MGKDVTTGKEVTQAVRFNKNLMPEEKAREWWKTNAKRLGREFTPSLESIKVTVKGIDGETGKPFEIPNQNAKEATDAATARRDLFSQILECLSA